MPATGGNVFLDFFKAKNKEIQKNCFTIVYIKNRIAHFWKIRKKYLTFVIFNFLLGDCSLIYQEGFSNLKKILIFKVPGIFFY